MGVDFLTCPSCEEVFADCQFVRCQIVDGGCGTKYCHENCAMLKEVHYKTTCIDCRGELPNIDNLFYFLLTKYGLNFEQVKSEYLGQEKQ